MFAALVEFNSLQDAIDCYKSEEYQSALAELGEKPEESVIRNLSIFEGQLIIHTGTISKGVHEYNDIRAALVASGVNETKQAKHKNTIYCNGMPLFEFGSCW